MRESSLWATMKRNLSDIIGLDLIRLENSAGNGTPDVNGCFKGYEFWVELKHLHEFPVRPSTKVRIDHYTKEQRIWIKNRAAAGGQVWLFVQVGKEYFLFDAEQAQHVTDWTADEWRENGSCHWEKRCDWETWLMVVSKQISRL